MENKGADMSRKSMLHVDQTIIQVLGLGGSQSHAARAAGCSRRTVYRRLLNQDFKTKVDEFAAQLRNAAAQQLYANLNKSNDQMIQMMKMTTPSKFMVRNINRLVSEMVRALEVLPDRPHGN